jgi:hypothetical protein
MLTLYRAICGEVNHICEKYVEIKEVCIEKQQSCFISATLNSWSVRKLLDSTT